MHDVKKSKYFYRGRSQNWKTWKFAILTPCARGHAYRHHTYISYFHNRFQQLRQTPQKCPPPDTKLLAPTVYPLQGRKVDPNFKKNSENNFFRLHYVRPEEYAESIGEIRFQIRSQSREIFAILWPPCLLFPIRRNAASTTTRVGRYFALGYALCSIF